MRYFLYFQYDGTAYCGFQRQPDAPTVQETIERSLSLLLKKETAIVGAGRTDAGVHARRMAAHFDTEAPLSDPANLLFRLGGLLPADIAPLSIHHVVDDAHARFSALSRLYRYYITLHKDPFHRPYSLRVFTPLDVEKMQQAADCLFHYDDFTSFAKLHTDVKTNICHIRQASFTPPTPTQPQLVFTIEADRFLRGMVRAIVGTLLLVGRGKLSVQDFCTLIEEKDRKHAGDSASAAGLFFEDVTYPQDIFLS